MKKNKMSLFLILANLFLFVALIQLSFADIFRVEIPGVITEATIWHTDDPEYNGPFVRLAGEFLDTVKLVITYSMGAPEDYPIGGYSQGGSYRNAYWLNGDQDDGLPGIESIEITAPNSYLYEASSMMTATDMLFIDVETGLIGSMNLIYNEVHKYATNPPSGIEDVYHIEPYTSFIAHSMNTDLRQNTAGVSYSTAKISWSLSEQVVTPVDLKDFNSVLKILTLQPNKIPFLFKDDPIFVDDAIYFLQDISNKRNKAPILEAIGNKSTNIEETLNFTINGISPEELGLEFSADILPNGAEFNPQTRVFSWTPTPSQAENHVITFTATDTNNKSDSETITITVNDNTPVFNAVDYFPLKVGDWREYKKESTGSIDRPTISGTQLINGTNAFKYLYQNSGIEYYTSQSPGLQLYGLYDPSGVAVIFDTPLTLWPDNALIGKQYSAETTTSYIISGKQFQVKYQSTSSLIGLEDVSINSTVFPDCVKAFLQLTVTDLATNETLTNSRTFWFHKGTGVVKDIRFNGETWTILESYINGVLKTY
jgi:hypothetical protein